MVWKSAYKMWIITNVAGWTGLELGKPRAHKTYAADCYVMATGISKGLVCGVFPPAFPYYVYEEYKKW